ncbi:hypothetical protein McanMca71_000704 [Microsporum canis]|uniref:Antigenic thaumatin domain-containing protein n=1 Tax=Arthroderma otae (strain ATCC MYA-4605 / CBS 113480) TaxID=554155 RepID=C5FLM4_ARTOC|nr:conserved hypothetical protein [Microsporum canis CBS 113480]EEQ30596.1 conserved hypothetical protein [Microsporum canis CBS 113480]
MHSNAAFIALSTLAALVPSALAGGGGNVGTANVQNACGKDVYLWSIADSAGEKMITLKDGETHSEKYRTNGNGGGISIKMATDQNHNDISQFEYTLKEPQIFYDLSNIDGYPFAEGGISVHPSDSGCPAVVCEGGVKDCKEAYNQPKDDFATHGCPQETDLNVVLCAGGGSAGPTKMFKPVDKAANRPRHPHARPE